MDYETLPDANLMHTLLAGGVAGVMEHVVMYPVDTVKTRMQSLSHATTTISGVLKEMIKQEGIFRPFRGASAVVIGAGPAHALYFSSYEFTKERLAKTKINDNINYLVSATSATLIHDAISNPTEVIKQRLQMYNSPYKSVVECARKVFQQEGLSAFYRSYTTQLVMNLPYQAIHFTTYEFFQEMLNKERKYSPVVHVIAGGAAGASAAAFTTPLDVCKTLLNTQEEGVGTTRGLFEAIRKVYRVAGISGFFKGIQARVLYQMPATAVCWSTYEFFKYILYENKRKTTVTLTSPVIAATPTTSTSFEDNKLSKPLHHFHAMNKDVPASNTTPISPRELPAMSSVGLVFAHHTMHDLNQSTSQLTDFTRST